MATDKCKGCQSFCMRGAQVLGAAPGTSTDERYSSDSEGHNSYPTSWEQWKNLISGKEGTTIQSSAGLTATSQIDLADFIIAGYAEGTHNILDPQFLKTEEEQKQLERVKNPPPGNSSPTYTTECQTDMDSAKDGVVSNEIIYAHHYNDFLKALLGTKTSSVTQDTVNADQTVSNDLTSGIIIGQAADIDGKTVKKDDLIFAKQYIELAENASSLLYHPYQCNICNICEGSDWMETVVATYEAIAAQNPSYYPETTSVTISVNGLRFNLRPDCSGAVAACLFAYDPETIPSGAPASWSTYIMGPDGSAGSFIAKAGFEWVPGTNGDQPGDIQLKIDKHTQVIDEDASQSYSGGSTAGLRGKKSSINNYTYDGVWRDLGTGGSTSSGNFDNEISGGDDGETTGSWTTGRCTYYGQSSDDDNLLTGWMGIYYPNATGYHVAVPTVAGRIYPSIPYGTVLVVRNPDNGRSVRAVVADVGNFGPNGDYNTDAILDLPYPTTYQALGQPTRVSYAYTGEVLTTWDGGPV